MNLCPVLDKVTPELRLMYYAYMPEIQAIRAHWADLRREMKAKALVEHNNSPALIMVFVTLYIVRCMVI